MRTGIANLPLHGGKAPRWLFERMKLLAREIVVIIVDDAGPRELLQKLSDPYWFQALGCLLGFDWHSSGVTTTVCGALKEGIKGLENDLGFYVAGGKGGRSRKTPAEIETAGDHLSVDPATLVYASRMSAKVDTSALQDGYQLYHHAFFFTKEGEWSVVQQGMNTNNRYARRYHWLGEGVSDFVCEPHAAVCCDQKGTILNLVADGSGESRQVTVELACEKPDKIIKDLKGLKTLDLPRRHAIAVSDINPDRLHKTFIATYERSPHDFATLLGMAGVGPKTVRALSLIAELVYGAVPSHDDPVRFSFAHGGKDGYPYPVDRHTYDGSIAYLSTVVNRTKVGFSEKTKVLKRLAAMGERRRG